jgi:hypothetical protein
MTDNTNEQYEDFALLFYKESKVVGVCNVVNTQEAVKNIAVMFSNSTGSYLPNSGDYDTVGIIKMFPISRIIDGAMSEMPEGLAQAFEVYNVEDSYDPN